MHDEGSFKSFKSWHKDLSSFLEQSLSPKIMLQKASIFLPQNLEPLDARTDPRTRLNWW
jgi:hypothetical protein